MPVKLAIPNPTHLACRRCGVEKPFTVEHFHRQSHAPGGLRKVCRQCVNAGYVRPMGRPRDPHTLAILAGEYTEHRCGRCGVVKPFDAEHFPVNRHLSGGLRKICRLCARKKDKDYELARQMRWRRMNPDKAAALARRANARAKAKLYGITFEQYEAMWRQQDGRCAICGERETKRNRLDGTIRALHLDHCHTTGRVRELLCQRCNLAVGHVKDSPEVCRKMADYLERHRR